MTKDGLVTALDLPAASRVDRRVAKQLLIDNLDLASSDKRVISTGIEGLHWLAVIKPGNSGIAAVEEDQRTFRELAVLSLDVREDAKPSRAIELVHRAVPHHVFLITAWKADVGASTAHKRASEAQADRVVLEGRPASVWLTESTLIPWCDALLGALPVSQRSESSLRTLYDRWTDSLLALQAAPLIGEFRPAASEAVAQRRRDALEEYERLDFEIARVRAAANKAGQMAHRVELNLELTRLRGARAAVIERLSPK